jgi:hypothetical protein
MKVEMDHQAVVVYTALHRIEGDIHVPYTARLSDRLNQVKDFIPVTSAKVSTLDGQPAFAAPVVVVNKAHVVMITERHDA